MGIISEEAVTDNFKMSYIGCKSVFSDGMFLLEVFILLLIPYPIAGLGKGLLKNLPPTFTMTAFNWVDNSGAYPAHSHIYTVTYEISDIFLCACFLRIYFVFEALLALLPVNMLHGKRLCS